MLIKHRGLHYFRNENNWQLTSFYLPSLTYQAKCAKALLASAMRCTFSRLV